MEVCDYAENDEVNPLGAVSVLVADLQGQRSHEPEPSSDEPSPDSWWRVVRPGSQVRLYQQDQDDLVEGKLVEYQWQDGVKYVVDLRGDGRVLATDEQLLPQDSTLDWQVPGAPD